MSRKQGTGTYYTRLPDGSLLSQRTPAGTHYYLEDGLGSIVGMTDANGAVVAEYRYDPYGWVIYEKSGSPYNPWRFKSGYQSQTTLHYKFGHRWYDPQTGRWTQADPLEQPTSPGDWNRYAYVGADPINATDPLGSFSVRGFLKATAAVASVVSVGCRFGAVITAASGPGAVAAPGFVVCSAIAGTTAFLIGTSFTVESVKRR